MSEHPFEMTMELHTCSISDRDTIAMTLETERGHHLTQSEATF